MTSFIYTKFAVMLLILEKFYFQDIFDKIAAYCHALLEVYERGFFLHWGKKDCSLSINAFLFHVEDQLLYIIRLANFSLGLEKNG